MQNKINEIIMNLYKEDKNNKEQKIFETFIIIAIFLPIIISVILGIKYNNLIAYFFAIISYSLLVLIAIIRKKRKISKFYKIKDINNKITINNIENIDTFNELYNNSSLTFVLEPNDIFLKFIYNYLNNKKLLREEKLNIYTLKGINLIKDNYNCYQLSSQTNLSIINLKDLNINENNKEFYNEHHYIGGRWLDDIVKRDNKIDIQKSFEDNLKYISNTEKDVNDIKEQFIKTDTRYYLTIGKINCPKGRIIVSDPLAFLPNKELTTILETKIKPGEYPVEVSMCRSEEIGIRMCTVRLKIKDTDAIEYKVAKPTDETAFSKSKDGVLCGFPVETGLLSICDEQVAKEYRKFLEEWKKENPKGNYYNDYFESYFKESFEKLPPYQRECGDFIEWNNPKTNNKLVMITSGFGDGFYQSYWGYDSEKEICELIIPLINPDLFGL